MLEIKGIRFEVEINQKRIKNIYLRVEDDKVIVSAPKYMQTYEIYNFIESKRDWIYKVYQYYQYKKLNTLKYNGGESFYIFGEKYKLIYSIGNKNVSITDKSIYLTSKNFDDGIKYLYKHFESLLLERANEYLNKYLYILRDYGYDNVPDLNIKFLKGKWGVCYTRNNKINISYYILHYPNECLEYIVIHELTHFIIPNHSKRFYEIIEHNMPNYKLANEKLKL
ncbi:MAG: SprT family zinc-dependent metalloprotease [Erysipelotrichaceae bacterium]|nr:SprT family zinc-dependent metalloprotease [Erysipelotrichaceae bacterium]